MSAQQYREFARECLRWAEETTSEEDHRHFIEMAKAWMHAAAELRAVSDDITVPPPPRPARRKTSSNGRNVPPGT
jgi:hypothetical protein